MDTRQIAEAYLREQKMMQLATVRDGRPWICTVYFVHDADLNLYWLSLPTRRHSLDIHHDPHVAAAVPVQFDHPVVGMQFEGTAEAVDDIDTIKKVLASYVTKYGDGKDFVDRVVAGTNKHRLYKFTPGQAFLFDEIHYPDGARLAITI